MVRERIGALVEACGEPGRRQWLMWRLFALALLVRLGVFLWVHDWVSPNPWEYGVIADNLLAGKGFSGSAWFVPEGPTAFMAPLYVFMLYGCRLLFGAGGYAALQAIQCILGAGSVVLLFAVAHRAFNQKVAVFAALLLALNPVHAYLVTYIHPVVLLTMLLLTAVLMTQRAAERRTAGDAALLGLALGVGVLADPAMLCFAPLAVLWPWLTRPRDPRRGPALAAVALVITIAAVAPWTIRNYLVFDRFVPVKSQFGYVLWIGNHPDAVGTQTYLDEDGNVTYVERKVTPEQLARYQTMLEPDVYNEFGRKAKAYMLAHPAETLARTIRKASYYWYFPTRRTCERCYRGGLLAPLHHPEKIVWLPLLTFAVAGMVLARRLWRQWLLLPWVMVCYTALYAITSAGNNSRYRVPVEGLVTAFAGVTIAYVACRLGQRRLFGDQ